MADNVETDAASGGAVFASDEISNIHYQKILVGYGADGTWTRVTTSAGFPVQLETGHAAIAVSGTFWQATQPVSGTFWQATQPVSAAALPLPSGAATESTLSTLNGKVTACNTGAVVISSGTITTITNAVTVTATDLDVRDIDKAQDDILIYANTAKDASGTSYVPLVDADGHLQIDVLSGGGGGTQYIEGDSDATITGTAMLAEGTTNTLRAVRCEDDGALHVHDGGDSLTVDNAGTFAVQVDGSALTALQLIDDTVAVLGTATYTETTTKGNVVGAVRNDDKATLGNTDNEIVPLQVDAEGALYVNQAAAELKSASGVAAGGAPGTDDMIAAVAGKKLKVVALSLVATSTTINTVYIDNVDNDLYGNSGNGIALSLDADGDTIPGFTLQYNPAGWFKTDAVNEAVTLNTSAAQDIIWSISWIETD